MARNTLSGDLRWKKATPSLPISTGAEPLLAASLLVTMKAWLSGYVPIVRYGLLLPIGTPAGR